MLKPSRILRAAATNPTSWSETLNLPKSTFPARPTATDLLKYRKQCADELYAWQLETRPTKNDDGGDNNFVLHDGPPYANGAVHVGHALNKVLKDLIVRKELLWGKRVQYTPGWDCHGLPIELKALQAHRELGLGKEKNAKNGPQAVAGDASAASDAGLSPLGIRQAAKELAARAIEEQKESFRGWGVMGAWENPYKTMNAEFEINQLNVFREMVAKGLIYRQNKPVHWSPSSGTALAEAELEYDDNHRVVAAFVKFPLTHLPESLAGNGAVRADEVSALIWTTTPWTLPANKAIAVRSDMEYAVVEFHNESNTSDLQGQTILGKDRVEYLLSHLPEGTTAKVIVESIPGSSLEGCEYTNILSGEDGKIIHAEFVTSTSGTGLVHLAPGHGMDDYNVCMKLNIGPAFAPVDDHGKFTDKALPADPDYLKGLEVEYPGAKAVVKLLRDPASRLSASSVKPGSSLILATHNFRHKNPIDWRTKQPVITRATEQWFADAAGIREPALSALKSVDFIPESGKPRLESFLQGRSQWCISRQRSWGVPIPALFRKDTGEAVMTEASINHIIEVIKERGIDAWWSDPEDEPAWVPDNLQSDEYVRGKDTMDVWFDSGTSWTSLSPREGEPAADVYVEGTDQHRGWFQSSLLTYVARQNPARTSVAPFKKLITHGFTLDQEGRKMSKSIGNVISPEEILNGSLLPALKTKKGKGQGRSNPLRQTQTQKDVMGPDVLRLWVASSDYTKDVVIGQPVLHAVHQSLQKYRVTFKWLLGVLDDYPAPFPAEDLLNELYFADQIALHQLAKTAKAVHESYANYEFFKGVNAINRFINADLSAFYFEVIKDRLYADEPEVRLHTQTVCFLIMTELLRMLSPITPLLVEEVWAHMPETFKGDEPHPLRTIWDAPFTANFDTLEPEEMDKQMAALQRVSSAVKAAQEQARQAGRIGSGLACGVQIHIAHGTPFWPLLRDLEAEDELSELFVVSDAEIVEADPEMRAQMEAEEDEETREIRLLRENPEWKFEVEFDAGEDQEGRPVKGKAVVVPPIGEKCVRCWQYIAEEPETLCGRCVEVVGEPEEVDGEDEGTEQGGELPDDLDEMPGSGRRRRR